MIWLVGINICETLDICHLMPNFYLRVTYQTLLTAILALLTSPAQMFDQYVILLHQGKLRSSN